MLKDGFLRFCDDPELACCRGEAELGRLREENVRLRYELQESQRREKAAGCDGCAEWGKWENEIEYGYPNPCIKCKRRCTDNWSGTQKAGKGATENG